MTHIRRLLDITACTSAFGKPTGKSIAAVSVENSPKLKPKDQNLDLADGSMYPPPRLGQFYDFFSFSHLTPPFQCKFFYLILLLTNSPLVMKYQFCSQQSSIVFWVFWQTYEDQTVHSLTIRQRMISFRLM